MCVCVCVCVFVCACVCVVRQCVCVRERGRERDGQTDRQTGRYLVQTDRDLVQNNGKKRSRLEVNTKQQLKAGYTEFYCGI